MNKQPVAIMTDSTCCLPPGLMRVLGIGVVPIWVVHEGHNYRDGIDITASEVYKIMRRRESLPTTSTPSVGDFVEAHRRLAQRAESVLCITLTSLQSKTYNTACLARAAAREVIPNTPLEVLDSRAVAGALGFIVLETARAARSGATLPEAVSVAQGMMARVQYLAMVDTLYYLARTGRVARAASWAATLLSIKPLLEHLPSVGETAPLARPRTRQRAVALMLDTMAARVGGAPVHVAVNHADEPAEAERLMQAIRERFTCRELLLADMTPGMGVHAGPGVLGIGFYVET